MKQNKTIRFFGVFLLFGVLCSLVACNDWTDRKSVV